MTKKHAILLGLALALFVFEPSAVILAQRLHDDERDTKAQEAVKLAEEVTNKATFDNQLKNLDILSKRGVEVYFRGAKREMEANISGFMTWGDVRAFVGAVKIELSRENIISDDEVKKVNSDLQLDCGMRTTEFGKAVCAAEKELAGLKKAVADSEEKGKALEDELKVRLEKIAEIESLVNKAETFLMSDSKNNETIKGLSGVFLNLSRSFVNYTNKLAVIRNQPRDELKLLLQKIAVETLQVEADHWKTVGEIEIRRAEEQKDLNSLVKDVEFRLTQITKCMSVTPGALDGQKLSLTFSNAQGLATCNIVDPADARKEIALPKEEIIGYLFQTLHSASALAARGRTPADLALLRLSQEERRYSVRQSAVIARGYELALSTGTKRLSRYYAGGLKPEKIAQLIYAAATVAIPGVIAGK
jgi:hypothetical protein